MLGLRRTLVVGGELALNGLFPSLTTPSKLRHSQQASKFRKFRNAMLDYSVLLNFVKPLCENGIWALPNGDALVHVDRRRH